MKAALKILSLSLLCAIGLWAGEYADAFLELGVSGRAAAMANSIGALDFSETAFMSNPAGIGYIRQVRVGLMYASQFGLADHNYFGLALPIGEHYAAACSWVRFGVDDIPIYPDLVDVISDKAERRDSVISVYNSNVATFNDVENAVFISLARYKSTIVDLGWRYSKFKMEFPIGINVKLIHKKYYNMEGFGLGIDIGGRLRVSGEELFDIYHLGMLSVGLALKDITGTTIYWNTQSQDCIALYPALSFGLEQPINPLKLLINFTAEKHYRYHDKSSYGLEIVYANRLALRTGLKKSGISLGLGLNFKAMMKTINLDYSFYNHDLGATHRVGLGIGI